MNTIISFSCLVVFVFSFIGSVVIFFFFCLLWVYLEMLLSFQVFGDFIICWFFIFYFDSIVAGDNTFYDFGAFKFEVFFMAQTVVCLGICSMVTWVCILLLCGRVFCKCLLDPVDGGGEFLLIALSVYECCQFRVLKFPTLIMSSSICISFVVCQFLFLFCSSIVYVYTSRIVVLLVDFISLYNFSFCCWSFCLRWCLLYLTLIEFTIFMQKILFACYISCHSLPFNLFFCIIFEMNLL